MARFRRESRHSDGITNQKILQRTSATKSAQSGHQDVVEECPFFRGKADMDADIGESPFLTEKETISGGVRHHLALFQFRALELILGCA
jgi:hypothetical protein